MSETHPNEDIHTTEHNGHDGHNAGDVPMRLLAVYMGAEGVPNTVMRTD